MTTIGTLSVELVAKTAKLTRPLGTAAKQVTSLGSVVNKVGQGVGQGLSTIGNHLSRMGPAGTAAGLALDGIGQSLQGLLSFSPAQFFSGIVSGITGVAAALSSGVLGEMQRIDLISKASRRIGETTETLAGLEHAAGLSGVGFQELVKGLERGGRSIAQAARDGTGEASRSLAQLGLDAQKLNQMRPAQQLLAISDAMQGVDTAGDRLKIVADIFGARATSFIGLLEGGPDAIREMIVEAEEFGRTFSAAQGSAVEAANDAMSRVKTAFDGIVTQLATHVAPALEDIASRVSDFFKEHGNEIATWIEVIVTNFGAAWDVALAAIDVFIAKANRKIAQWGSGLGVDLTGGFVKSATGLRNIPGINQALDGLQDAAREKMQSATGDAFTGAVEMAEARLKGQVSRLQGIVQEISQRRAAGIEQRKDELAGVQAADIRQGIGGFGLFSMSMHMASQMALAAAGSVQKQIAGPGTIEAGSAEGFRLQAQWQQPMIRQQVDLEQEQVNLLSQMLQELRGGPGEIELGGV